jgi:hypothetical protein
VLPPEVRGLLAGEPVDDAWEQRDGNREFLERLGFG